MPEVHLVPALFAAAVLGAAVAISVVWLRRMSLLGHRSGTFRCWVGVAPDGPWRPGLAEYSEDRLSWWPRFSLGGALRWQRTCLTVSSRSQSRSALPGAEQMLVLTCCVSQPDQSSENLYLLLDPATSAGLTSWLEAAPRSPNRLV